MFEKSGKPKVFIGSSSEQKTIAELVKEKLRDYADSDVWSEKFPLSEGTMESLVNAISGADFGVFVLSDDDVIEIRKRKFTISRANVIFEAGMSIGALGKKRTFLLAPIREKEFTLPSDLFGFTVAQYDKDEYAKDPSKALDMAIKQMVEGIRISRWSMLNLNIKAKILIDNTAPSHPWKLWIEFKNDENFALTCLSKEFIPKTFKIVGGQLTYQPVFFYYVDPDTNQHIRKPAITLQPKESTNCYVPLEVAEGIRISKRNMLKIDCGGFHFDCIAHDNSETLRYQAAIKSESYTNNSSSSFGPANLQGQWDNYWGGAGHEKVFIDNHMNYFINDKSKPDFIIRSFEIEGLNKIKFMKKGVGRSDFENKLTLIDENILIGLEYPASGDPHEIRFVRKI